MKKYIDPFEYASQILQGVEKGATITVCRNGQVNPMSISWGTMGVQWGKRLFTCFVREARYTKGMLDDTMEFTVNIPMGGENTKKIIGFCGSRSGRDTDKVAELGLTLESADHVTPPAIRELPLTLECKVVYCQKQDPDAIPEAFRTRYYPHDVPGADPQQHQDYHTAYNGEIVAAYIVE